MPLNPTFYSEEVLAILRHYAPTEEMLALSTSIFNGHMFRATDEWVNEQIYPNGCPILPESE